MIISDPSVLVPDAPVIDASEARWAAEHLLLMLARLDPDSPVCMVLTQARRELTSLVQSAGAAATVIGPLRVAA